MTRSTFYEVAEQTGYVPGMTDDEALVFDIINNAGAITPEAILRRTSKSVFLPSILGSLLHMKYIV